VQIFDVLGFSALVLLTALLCWLALRFWRARRPLAKWLCGVVASILALASLLLVGAALAGYWRLNRSYDNPVHPTVVEATPERLQRGEWFQPYCSGCHAEEQGAALTGQDFLGEDAPPIGEFHAPNLTPVHLGDWSDGEIIRAIREGVHRDGRSLLIMPSKQLRNLSDEDVFSIVVYLRSLPPEGEATPRNRLNVLGAIMVLTAPIFEAQPPLSGPVIAPPPGPTAAYGAYLSSFTCNICHGDDGLGDPEFPSPPLIGIPLAWNERAFIDFLRTGTRPDGSKVDEDRMPWKEMSAFLGDDDELRAIYAHMALLAKGVSE
jgi:mono/diheme cytochrome c family protein